MSQHIAHYLVNGPPPNVLAVTVPVWCREVWDCRSVGYKESERSHEYQLLYRSCACAYKMCHSHIWRSVFHILLCQPNCLLECCFASAAQLLGPSGLEGWGSHLDLLRQTPRNKYNENTITRLWRIFSIGTWCLWEIKAAIQMIYFQESGNRTRLSAKFMNTMYTWTGALEAITNLSDPATWTFFLLDDDRMVLDVPP